MFSKRIDNRLKNNDSSAHKSLNKLRQFRESIILKKNENAFDDSGLNEIPKKNSSWLNRLFKRASLDISNQSNESDTVFRKENAAKYGGNSSIASKILDLKRNSFKLSLEGGKIDNRILKRSPEKHNSLGKNKSQENIYEEINLLRGRLRSRTLPCKKHWVISEELMRNKHKSNKFNSFQKSQEFKSDLLSFEKCSKSEGFSNFHFNSSDQLDTVQRTLESNPKLKAKVNNGYDGDYKKAAPLKEVFLNSTFYGDLSNRQSLESMFQLKLAVEVTDDNKHFSQKVRTDLINNSVCTDDDKLLSQKAGKDTIDPFASCYYGISVKKSNICNENERQEDINSQLKTTYLFFPTETKKRNLERSKDRRQHNYDCSDDGKTTRCNKKLTESRCEQIYVKNVNKPEYVDPSKGTEQTRSNCYRKMIILEERFNKPIQYKNKHADFEEIGKSFTNVRYEESDEIKDQFTSHVEKIPKATDLKKSLGEKFYALKKKDLLKTLEEHNQLKRNFVQETSIIINTCEDGTKSKTGFNRDFHYNILQQKNFVETDINRKERWTNSDAQFKVLFYTFYNFFFNNLTCAKPQSEAFFKIYIARAKPRKKNPKIIFSKLVIFEIYFNGFLI